VYADATAGWSVLDPHVLGVAAVQPKVRGAVIGRVVVDVVDHLTGAKLSANHVPHDDPGP
jgi:hypothetical protein